MSSPLEAAPAGKRRWFDTRQPLPPRDATHRTTAFIYGNVLVLAALVQVSFDELSSVSVVAVLATAVSTFLVHIFAGVITTTWSWHSVRREARDSAPILTSGVLPAALLLIFLGVPPLAVILAELLVIVRIGLIGVVVARLRTEPVNIGTVGAGSALAMLALVIVVTKVVLIH